MSNVLTVTTYQKKVNLKSQTLTLIIMQKKIDGTTVMNETNRKGGDSETITNPNRIECQRTVCNDRIRNDEVANILLSLNRKNTFDNSCNDKEDNNGEGENK